MPIDMATIEYLLCVRDQEQGWTQKLENDFMTPLDVHINKATNPQHGDTNQYPPSFKKKKNRSTLKTHGPK